MNKQAYFKLMGLEKKALRLPKLIPNFRALAKLPRGRARKAVGLQAIRKLLPISQLSRIAETQQNLSIPLRTKQGWIGDLSKSLIPPGYQDIPETAAKLYPQKGGKINFFFPIVEEWQDNANPFTEGLAYDLNRLTSTLGHTLSWRRKALRMRPVGQQLESLDRILKNFNDKYGIKLK